MALTAPYEQKNYMGEFANAAACEAAVVARGWDSGGSPQNGMWYYDTTLHEFRGSANGAWASIVTTASLAYTVIVAQAGGSFTSIQDAIDSITVAGGERYNILIYPGDYNENITLKNGVDLVGVGAATQVVIYANTGTVLDLGAGYSNITNLTLRSTPTAPGAKLIYCNVAGVHVTKGCAFQMYPTGTYATAIDINVGVIIDELCDHTYTQTGVGGGDHIANRAGSLGGGVGFGSSYAISVAAAADDVYAYKSESDIPGSAITSGVRLGMEITAAGYSGNAYVIHHTGTASGLKFVANVVELVATGGAVTGNGCLMYINSGATGTAIATTGNKSVCAGFANNCLAEVAVNDTYNSHFEEVQAADGVMGAGTYNFVNSPSSGDIQVSGSYFNMYDQALTVGQRGADHTSIQDAIDAITDAGPTKLYVILVYPGTYTDNVDLTGKPYINLRGMETNTSTIISVSSGVALTFNPSDSSVSNLTIQAVGDNVLHFPAGATGKNLIFRDCVFDVTCNNTFCDATEINSGNVVFKGSTFNYNHTGTGGGTHRIASILGASNVTFKSCTINMDIAAGAVADAVTAIEEGNATISFKMEYSNLLINRTGAVTGLTIGYLANGTSADKNFHSNFVGIVNGGSGGTAQCYKTAGNGCAIHSTASRVHVQNFTLNYHAEVGATDFFASHFDDLVAVDRITGAGDYAAVHSEADGDLEVTRDLEVQRNVLIEGVLQLASGTTANELSIDGTLAGDSDDALPTEKAVKAYVDTELGDYVKSDGTVAFTGAVAGVTPVVGVDLSTKAYVDAVAAGGGANDLGSVEDKDLVTAPSPVIGEKYIIAGIGGAWSGGTINDVAECTDDSPETWDFTTPTDGNYAWVIDEAIQYTFSGGSWSPSGSSISHLALQDIGSNAHTVVDSHLASTSNPHSVDKTDVSLGNVTDDAQLKRAADDILSFAEKTSNHDNDLFLIEDSNDAGSKKRIKALNIFDRKAKISSNDTAQDYLINKLIGTASKVTVTEVGDGGDEDLQFDVGADIFDKTVDDDGDVLVNLLGSPTHDSLRDVRDHTQSSGYTTGGLITDATGGQINVSAGTGFIRATASGTAPLLNFDFAAAAGVSLTDNSTNYVYVAYNAGSPIVQITLSPDFSDSYTKVILGRVYRDGNNLVILQAGALVTDFARRALEQSFWVLGIRRTTGMITSEIGTRNLSVTAGEAWYVLQKYNTTAKDTSAADTFDYWYRAVTGWTRVTGQTAIDNTQYDDGTGTLATLTDGYYGVHWVSMNLDDAVHVKYGQADYATLTEAQTSQPPVSPPLMQGFGTLIAKIIILKNATSFTEVQVSLAEFTPASPANHNELAQIDGGTSGEYYHLTSTQHDALSSTGGVDDADLQHTHDHAIHDNVAGEINAITAKTTLVDADIMLLEDSAATYDKKKVTHADLKLGIAGVFGNEYQQVYTVGTVVTGITVTAAETLTTGTVPAGDYLISWYIEWQMDQVSADFGNITIVEDATTTVGQISQNAHSTQDWNPFSGAVHRTLTNASHTFVLNIWRSGGAGNITARKRTLIIWRVA